MESERGRGGAAVSLSLDEMDQTLKRLSFSFIIIWHTVDRIRGSSTATGKFHLS